MAAADRMDIDLLASAIDRQKSTLRSRPYMPLANSRELADKPLAEIRQS